MRIALSVILTLLMGSPFAFAQEAKPSLTVGKVEVENNAYAARGVKQKLESRLKKNYDVISSGYILLEVAGSFGKMHTINGMDTYTVAEASLTYTLSAEGLPNRSKTLSIKCKGTNEKDLAAKLGTTVARNRAHCDELHAFIQEYINANLGSCSKVTSAINQQLANREIAKANSLLGYYDALGNCEEAKSKSEQAILDKHQAYACDVIIKKSTILANSASWQDLSKAIDMLLMVPPDAPCAQEAISVAELVSEKAKELGSYYTKRLQDPLIIINTITPSDWRAWYRENYSKIY